MIAYDILLTMSNRDNETPNLNWSEVVKKEARGQNKEDLGEVQEVGETLCVGPERNNKQGQILYPKIFGARL